MLYDLTMASPIGPLLIVDNGQSLLGVWMHQQKYFANSIQLDKLTHQTSDLTKQTSAWLTNYFAGQHPTISKLPLDPQITDFQKRVLKILIKIPYGKTWTYKEIAQELGSKNYTRAIGQAVGHNPISIIIPCHRVVGTNGNLTGYAGGIERKKFLLKFEQDHTKKSPE